MPIRKVGCFYRRISVQTHKRFQTFRRNYEIVCSHVRISANSNANEKIENICICESTLQQRYIANSVFTTCVSLYCRRKMKINIFYGILYYSLHIFFSTAQIRFGAVVKATSIHGRKIEVICLQST